MASPEENKATVRRASEAWNARDRAAFDKCYADELIVRTGDGPDDFVTMGHDEHWEVSERIFAQLDLRATERKMVAEGDTVFVRWRYWGTHRGVIRGAEPTGKQIEFDGWQLLRLADGLIAEERTLLDRLSLYEQLGIVELPEP